jgi:hypothetical protein
MCRRSSERSPSLTPALFATVVFIIAWMRFRAPIDPFLILLAALAIDAAWTRARS